MRRSGTMFAPRRRVPWLGVSLVVGSAAIVAVVWTVSVAGGLWDSPERVISDELERDPSTPVLVPTELPSGYTLLGPGRKVADEDGRTLLATWLYGPAAAGSDLPLVELCISRRGEGLRGSCADEQAQVLTTARGHRLRAVAVSLAGGSDDRVDVWQDVTLTRHWDEVAWVTQRRSS